MDDFNELIRDYIKPDYLTPTSIGPISTGTSILEMYEKLLLDTSETYKKADGRDAKELA